MKRGATSILSLAALLGHLALGALVARSAEPGEAGHGDEGRRTRMVVVLRIAEELDLDEEETIHLASEYRKFDARRRELLGEKSVTEVELEAALARQPANQGELARLTDDLLRIDRELALMPDKLFQSLQSRLDTEQKARLALLKAKLQKKIDRERRRRETEPARPPSRS